jgi:peptide/nickel transport system ATP-binding protein
MPEDSIFNDLGDSANFKNASIIKVLAYPCNKVALAAEYCSRIAVMHAGHLVELAPTSLLFARPRHPYTAKLIAATPGDGTRLDQLTAIPGAIPDLRRIDLPVCRYSERCERATADCREPPLLRVVSADGRLVACRHPL